MRVAGGAAAGSGEAGLRLRLMADRLAQALADFGAPAALFGGRRTPRRDARAEAERAGRRTVIHAPAAASNPLPRNVTTADALPADRGWWGFSFRDVPYRASGPTSLLEFEEVDLLTAREPRGRRNYHPAFLDARGRSLTLREIRHRPVHAALTRARPTRRIGRGVWIAERVYDNHSHWLTAHLPKLRLLRELGRLDDLVLPMERTPVMEASLRLFGIEPDRVPAVATGERVTFERLTLLETDRFRPELLRAARDALAIAGEPRRRVFISRRRAGSRRLLEERALEPMLRARGFELVEMETLNFGAQLRLMSETAVLAAPHGAGLTNMMFCPAGLQVVEIADLDFPNPNFYALSAALGHDYWLVPAHGRGDGHPLYRDLSVDPEALETTLEALEA